MKKRVLIVDDSVTMRDMVAFTLSSSGFDVVQAGNGVLALESLNANAVDLVITDINMPEMDGIELIANIRKHPEYRRIPILCLTTEQQRQTKDAAKSAGATGWLQKPFEPERLVEVANKVCP